MHLDTISRLHQADSSEKAIKFSPLASVHDSSRAQEGSTSQFIQPWARVVGARPANHKSPVPIPGRHQVHSWRAEALDPRLHQNLLSILPILQKLTCKVLPRVMLLLMLAYSDWHNPFSLTHVMSETSVILHRSSINLSKERPRSDV